MSVTRQSVMARILIIDDDEAIQQTSRAILVAEGHEVDAASVGAEGMQMSEQNCYNVALIDMRLPDMLGTELLSLLKENVPKTIKIMITGFATLENAVEALNKGADFYMMKPFDPENLIATVRKGLEKQAESRAMTEERIADFIKTRASELFPSRKGVASSSSASSPAPDSSSSSSSSGAH
jgi:DNA-binding NtrC family response regulator